MQHLGGAAPGPKPAVGVTEGSPLCSRSALHTKEQQLGAVFLQIAQRGPAVGAERGEQRCKAPIEAPLIFQGFSGFGLYKTQQEEERGERDSRQEETLPPAALSSSNNSVKTEK